MRRRRSNGISPSRRPQDGAAVASDDAGETTDRVAIYWVVNRAVADAAVVHFADDGFESFDVVGWVAIEFDVGDVTSVTKIVVRSFDFDFLEGRNWVINRDMEGVGVEFTISDAFELAKFLAIHSGEAASKTFGWSGEKREI